MRVLDLIRGHSAMEALSLLSFLPHKAARMVEEVLKSAVANAVTNHKLPKPDLVVSEAWAGPGATQKRWQPVSRGRAHPILKRTAHITLFVRPEGEI